MMDKDSNWELGQLPFIWKPLGTPHNPEGLPDTLPFTLSVDPLTGVFTQADNPEVSSSLARAYSLGSAITGQMGGSGIGRGYADDFLEFVRGGRDWSGFKGRRVLEIGCGNGYLLHRLSLHGADVLGIDPGEHPNATYGVPIIRDFFPTGKVTGRFDAIIGFAMLEHVENPCEFIQQLLELLEPEGEILLGVPDCGPYIDAGDISCLFHEHWSYFDGETLARIAQQAGGEVQEIRTGHFGGMLYARVAGGHVRLNANHPRLGAAAVQRLRAFRALAEQGIEAVSCYIGDAEAKGEMVGVYVPGRIVNSLFAGQISTASCRFFDDNPLLKGTYFPGLDIAVENRSSLIDQPTERVLIMSRSFGYNIARELTQTLPSRVVITGWHELFGSGDRRN